MTTLQSARKFPTGPRRMGKVGSGQLLGLLLAVLLGLTLVLHTTLAVGYGAGMEQGQAGATELRGYLSSRHDRHYLGLRVEERFTTVRVQLHVQPMLVQSMRPSASVEASVDAAVDATADSFAANTVANEMDHISEGVNFLVLTELGLQRFLSGADPLDVNLAAGTLQPVDTDTALDPSGPGEGFGSEAATSVLMEAQFRAVGRGGYTLLIYNTGDVPALYRLEVAGGVLIDGSGQTYPAANSLGGEGAFLPVAAGFTGPTMTTLPVATLGRPSGKPVRAQALGGQLPADSTRHYFVLEPTASNGEMTLSLAYENVGQVDGLGAGIQTGMEPGAAPGSSPADLSTLSYAVNYWVFTEAGLRQMDQGAPAEFLSLASGTSFLGVPNLLRTRVRLAGETAYAVVVYNDSPLPVDYRLRVEGGNLVDLYRQSSEAHGLAGIAQDMPSGETAADGLDRGKQTGPWAELLPDSAPDSAPDSVPEAVPDSLKVPDFFLAPGVTDPDVAKQTEPLPLEIPPADGFEDALSGEPDLPGEAGLPGETDALGMDEETAEPDSAALPVYRMPVYHTDYTEGNRSGRSFAAVAAQRDLGKHLGDLALAGGQQQRWIVQPDSAFSRVVLTLEQGGEPDDQSGTAWTAALADLRIWVVSKEGVRRLDAGLEPQSVSVSGLSVLRLGREAGVLQASFDPAGYDAYVVVVENLGDAETHVNLNVRNGIFLGE